MTEAILVDDTYKDLLSLHRTENRISVIVLDR